MDLTCPSCLTRNHPAATKCYQCQVPLVDAHPPLQTPPVTQWAVPEDASAVASNPEPGAVAHAQPARRVEPVLTAQVAAPAQGTTVEPSAGERQTEQPEPAVAAAAQLEPDPEAVVDHARAGVAVAPPMRTPLISAADADAPTGPHLRTSLGDQPGHTVRRPLPPIAAPVGYDAANPFAPGTAVHAPGPEVRGNAWEVRESPRAQAIAAAQERPPQPAAGSATATAARPGYAPTTQQQAYPPELAYESWDARDHGMPGGARRSAAIRIALLLIVALVGIGYLGHRYLLKGGSATHTISLPTSIAGQAQLKGNATLDAVSAQFNKTMTANRDVKQALAGVYTSSLSATDGYVLMLLLVRSSGVAPGDAFNNFQASNPALGVNVGATVTKAIDGTDYQCVPATNSNTGASAVVCVWQDHDVVGLLVALNAANPEVIASTAAKVAQAAEHATG